MALSQSIKALFQTAPALGRKLQDEFDYIVVGAGSAGCVVASRLSEDPSISVLLIEAGGSNQSFKVRSPLVALADLQNSEFDWAYRTVPQGPTDGRVSHWPRGKCLGGSSSINYMAYVRGDPRNYDDWARQGCTGWSYEEVLPFFKKSENLVASKDLGSAHGRNGPLTITRLDDGDFSGKQIGEMWVDACDAAGLPKTDDYNGPVQRGASLLQANVHKATRGDTASAFLFGTGAMKRNNLTVLTDACVTKVLVDDKKKASGVTLSFGNGASRSVKASREIILSCGAVGTPQLLMLSGIGPQEHLKEHGIECLQNLPVGENLQDHLLLGVTYKTKPGKQPFSPNRPLTGGVFPDLGRHLFFGTGNFSFPPLHGTAFYHSGLPDHDESRGNDTQIHFVSFSAMTADHQVKNFGLPRPSPKLLEDGIDAVALVPVMLLPQSRGSVKLASADPKQHPIIDPQYYSHPRDMEVMVEAYKFCRTIAATPPLSDVLGEEVLDDGEFNGRAIPYPPESEEYVREVVRRSSVTIYHPVGTAKMGSEGDSTAVVDTQLRVRGVAGLRVADASIMPTVISGNTNAPCVMIGERCADFLRPRSRL